MPAFAYTILYVPSVPEALDHYASVFGLEKGFLHESGDYGELKTGATRLAFTSHELAAKVIPRPYRAAEAGTEPFGMELTLAVDDVDAAYARAVAAGAHAVSEPHDEPWGQRVSYVTDLNNVLVGLVSPMPA